MGNNTFRKTDLQSSKPTLSYNRGKLTSYSELSIQQPKSLETWPVSQQELEFLPTFPIKVKNNFKYLLELSKGSYGTVYKVEENDKLFALKVLSKAKVVKENAIQQVKDEVNIQKACGHHPFIVECIEYWQTKKTLFIVTELVSGGDLKQLLSTYGVLSKAIAQLYVAQIAIAIDFLHNAGIIHRDIKPENILLDGDTWNIRITDFGFAKWLSYGQKTNTICGTLSYIA